MAAEVIRFKTAAAKRRRQRRIELPPPDLRQTASETQHSELRAACLEFAAAWSELEAAIRERYGLGSVAD